MIIMTRVERKSVGLAAGSKTVDDDWNDWNKPAISLDRAKLLRKRTCVTLVRESEAMEGLKSPYQIRNCSIEKNQKSIFLSRTLDAVDAYTISARKISAKAVRGMQLPSKSNATIMASSVGVTDIHTPSVQIVQKMRLYAR